jgi:hypothetical protein
MAGRLRGADRAGDEKQALDRSVTAGLLATLATKAVTVTGEISPEELAICDAHNRIWIEPVADAGRDAPVLDGKNILRRLALPASGGQFMETLWI